MEGDNFNQIKEEAKKKAEYDAIPVISYSEFQAVINKWLLIADKGVVKLVVATVIANMLPSDPIWVFLVGKSGGGKTELMNGLLKLPQYYSLSQLTPNTFLSGYKSKDKEPSLLLQLGSGKTLGFKDFTSLLDGNKDDLKALLGQFRELYDQHMVKRTGTGDTITWKGKMGFLAGTTRMIEERMSIVGAMGERFMNYYITQPEQVEVRKRMKQNLGKEKQMRDEIQDAFAGYLKGIIIPENLPEIPPDVDAMIQSLSDFIAMARTVVMRDFTSKHEISYIADSEMTTRVYKQLLTVAITLLIMNGGDQWLEEDTYIVKKLALSSIHSKRLDILKTLQQYKTQVKTSTLSVTLGYPTSTIRNTLEELAAIKMDEMRIITRIHQVKGKPDLWELTISMKRILIDMGESVEATKEDGGFEKDEEEIPVGALPEDAGSRQEEFMNQKVEELTDGMTQDELKDLGL